MQQAKERTYTVEEYLSIDEAAPDGTRLEYCDGRIYLNGRPYDPSWGWERARAMAGATPAHNRIVSNLLYALRGIMDERGCDVLAAEQQMRLTGGTYVYPNLVVACDPSYDGVQLTNPQLVIEVVSASTAENDLGWKLDAYSG